LPHVLCLTEHHQKYLQLEKVHIESNKLGAHYCRQIHEKGGVAIFAHNSLDFSNTDIAEHCKEFQITNSHLNSNTVSKWTKIKYRVPQGSIFGPLLFLEYINNLPKAIEHKAFPILFADYTSILLISSKNIETQSNLNIVFDKLIKWFKSNSLFLNFDKTYFIQFTSKKYMYLLHTN
jgi:hypothetical protein